MLLVCLVILFGLWWRCEGIWVLVFVGWYVAVMVMVGRGRTAACPPLHLVRIGLLTYRTEYVYKE